MFDILAFLIGIFGILGSATFCIYTAIQRHHEREMRAYEIRVAEQNQRFIIMNELIKQKMLPPGYGSSIFGRID